MIGVLRKMKDTVLNNIGSFSEVKRFYFVGNIHNAAIRNPLHQPALESACQVILAAKI